MIKFFSLMDFNTAFTAIQDLIAECGSDSDRFAERLRAERIPHLSFSQVTTVEACPYRYYLQYVRGIQPDPVPEYFTKGKLLHQLIARDYSTRCFDRLSTSRFDRLSERRFDAPTNLGQVLSTRPAYEDEVALQFSGQNLAHLLNALELHRRHAWREAEVVGVEHPFVMILDPFDKAQGTPDLPPVVGVIDLVLRDEDGYLLVDHKTGRNFYPDDELQVAIYARYIQGAYGRQRTRLFYDHYRWVNNLSRIRKPAFQRVEVRADPARWPRDLARIRRAYGLIREIREGGAAPRCGECFRCPYRGMCRC